MNGLRFAKMHGLGNDFLVTDSFRQPVALNTEIIAALADRHTGVGFDQLLLLEPHPDPAIHARYRIFNADGSPAGQCGNGARCAGVYLQRLELVQANPMVLAVDGGQIEIALHEDGLVAVNMGEPDFHPESLPARCTRGEDPLQCTLLPRLPPAGLVSMGNPHAVLQVEQAAAAPVAHWGPEVQALPRFPQGVNVGFMEIVDRDRMRLRVYERGAGETRACGTGACAAAAVGMARGQLNPRVTVSLPGGDLQIEWAGPGHDLWMHGPAVWVFEGRLHG